MKKIKIVALLITIPLLLMVLVNELSPTPTFDFQENKCSRYCHNAGCHHTTISSSNNIIASKVWKVYVWNIAVLKNNPLGLSYQNMNVLLYVLIAPLLILFLLVRLLKKRNGLD